MRRDRTLVLAAVLVAGCSQGSAPTSGKSDPGNEPAPGDDHIACAVDGAAELKPVCTVERVQRDGKLELVVRHPGGGFRRFLVTSDGRGLITADGAQQLDLDYDADGFADVRIGGYRYRFPARRKGP